MDGREPGTRGKAAPYEPPASSVPKGRRDRWRGARIEEVAPGSPAAREGLEPGMVVTHVNGVELRDMVDWEWEADGPEAYLEGVAHPGEPGEFEFECTLARDWGEDWGVSFDGAVFDGMRLCRNDCLFCFMKMLPPGMRRTLYMRDDDYRLSFLQGNFVTLTNVSDDDVERIVSCALSPLNVSLHAVTPSVRARLMGRNAQRGLDVLERLLEGGVEIHAQIVLVPGENDGEELFRTLRFVEERPLVTSLGIVPLGFTKFQDAFSSSFNSDPEAARAVVEAVRPFQLRSRAASGRTRYQLADEFYLAAGMEPPCAEEYDGYPQYYDGIGMVRSFLDEAREVLSDPASAEALASFAGRLAGAGERLWVVSGRAAAATVARFLDEGPLGGVARVLSVENRYFGGNVDVTGLLTASDVLGQLPRDLARATVLLPELMFNADGLTLDGMAASELAGRIEGCGARRAAVVPTTPRGIVRAVVSL